MKLFNMIQTDPKNIAGIYLLAGLASIFLSVWISSHEYVINADAICYILSAQEVGQSGLTAAMHLCPQAKWPFYTMLIFAFSKISHLSYLVSAYTLDGFFSLVSVLAFVNIVRQMGASRSVLWFAVFVILFAHEFNSVRQYIIRDHGFWAFYLLSVSFLIRFFEKADANWLPAIGWSAAIMIATLFRIEGTIFLVVIPLTALFVRDRLASRLTNLAKLYLPVLIALLLLIMWATSHPVEAQDKLSRFAEIQVHLSKGVHNILWRYQSSLAAMKQYVFSPESMRDAGMIWMLSLIAGYVMNVVLNLSVVCTMLCIYAWIKRIVRLPQAVYVVLITYILLNLLITSAFYAQLLFLSKRYLIALSLIFWLWVPFALARLQQSRHLFNKIACYFAIVIIAASSFSLLLKDGSTKIHIREAGNWLASQLINGKTLYTNDYQLMYYSQQFGSHIFKMHSDYQQLNLKAGDWKKFDYLALRTDRSDAQQVREIIRQLSEYPVRIFENRRGEQILVYQVVAEENKS